MVSRDISDRKKAQELIQFQAYHDLLTRLLSRELLMDRLQLAISQANRGGHQLAVLSRTWTASCSSTIRWGTSPCDKLL